MSRFHVRATRRPLRLRPSWLLPIIISGIGCADPVPDPVSGAPPPPDDTQTTTGPIEGTIAIPGARLDHGLSTIGAT